jgi:hypothetical protein
MKRTLGLLVLLSSLVAVAAALAGSTAVTINADKRSVVFGGAPTLTGNAPANGTVTVNIQPTDEPVRTSTVKADSHGLWHLTVHPWVRTTYKAASGSDASTSAVVFVKPRIALARTGLGRYRVTIAAGRSFAGQSLLIDRQTLTKPRHWITLKRVTMQKYVAADGTTVASFTANVRFGTPLKAFLQGKVAGSLGYLGATSNAVTS